MKFGSGFVSRAWLVMLASALVVSYARQFLQYGEYGYPSLIEFLGSWLIHYFALGFGTFGYMVALKWARSFSMREPPQDYSAMDMDDLMVQFATAAMVLALFAYALAHLGSVPEDIYYDE